MNPKASELWGSYGVVCWWVTLVKHWIQCIFQLSGATRRPGSIRFQLEERVEVYIRFPFSISASAERGKRPEWLEIYIEESLRITWLTGGYAPTGSWCETNCTMMSVYLEPLSATWLTSTRASVRKHSLERTAWKAAQEQHVHIEYKSTTIRREPESEKLLTHSELLPRS